MTQLDLLQLVMYLGIILMCVKPLGWYMSQIYAGNIWGFNLSNNPIERIIYKCCAVDPQQDMDWKHYLKAMLLLNFFGWLAAYVIFRMQNYFPFNPQSFPGVEPELAFNTAASITSNTGWQAYAGENTMSYASQTLGLTVQNFLSAATGISILMAFIRGFVRRETVKLGNYWVDVTRSIIYVLIPLSVILAMVLVSQGVIQNFKPYQQITLLEEVATTEGPKVVYTQQTIPMGPVASLVASKQISSNGAGFFNTNSAHPFENPTPLSNLLESLALILIPAALCYTFGIMIKQKNHGWMLLGAMLAIYIPAACLVINAEKMGNPILEMAGIERQANYEGKEVRLGITGSSIWAVTTAASANGSVNSMLDSSMPVSSLILLVLMHFGEVIFGGVGSGLYGMIFIAMITVFIAGLMIGKTPEYLGKKIEPLEMKMIVLVVLVMPLLVLIFSAIACVTSMGTNSILNPKAHGFSEILYAFTSAYNNNGSAFAGLQANTTFYNLSTAATMLISRYWVAIATLTVAGAFARKRYIATSLATLGTHNILFVILVVAVIIFMGGITFLPTLALGPIVELLTLREFYGLS